MAKTSKLSAALCLPRNGASWGERPFCERCHEGGEGAPALGVKDEHLCPLFFCALPSTPTFSAFHRGLCAFSPPGASVAQARCRGAASTEHLPAPGLGRGLSSLIQRLETWGSPRRQLASDPGPRSAGPAPARRGKAGGEAGGLRFPTAFAGAGPAGDAGCRSRSRLVKVNNRIWG